MKWTRTEGGDYHSGEYRIWLKDERLRLWVAECRGVRIDMGNLYQCKFWCRVHFHKNNPEPEPKPESTKQRSLFS